MCGIAGFLAPAAMSAEAMEAVCRSMADTLRHRGPDAGGIWVDAPSGAALGHRRLAILDLSPKGAQPMRSACGRYVISYNGEVYNHLDLRAELEEKVAFCGRSDTETILAAIAHWGVEQAVGRMVGMFSFALWDCQEQRLTLVRDRLGIKPLYYGYAGDAFVFGSELKALRAHPGFENTVDRDALALYFRYNYVPSPHCIHPQVQKLPAGTMLSLDVAGVASGLWPKAQPFWSAREVWKRGLESPFSGDEDEAANVLEELLADAVSKRMLSDVPLGAFLSGGIDSSLVVALMQANSERPVKTFSIGFAEQKFDESGHARAVASHLGTDHTELMLKPEDLLAVIPEIPVHWDEPFSDSSQIPTLCVSRMARQDVTVCLSGDGGDELFAGYERYHWAGKWEIIRKVPLRLRRMAALGRLLPRSCFAALGSIGPKIHWRLDALSLGSLSEFYRFFLSHHRNPAAFVYGASEPGVVIMDDLARDMNDAVRRMTYWDIVQYLPDDILTKVDRASMAVSLEARVPLLDHRVVEFAASLPMHMKRRKGETKALLRKVLFRHVPQKLVDRPKMGFGVPIQSWLGGELRDWCEQLLSPARLREQGFVDAVEVQRLWQGYLGGQTYNCHLLWDVLMFQAWLENTGATAS